MTVINAAEVIAIVPTADRQKATVRVRIGFLERDQRIAAMEQERYLQQLTEADAHLKKIATQTIVTAQTEYLKFQRGDYLS